MDDERLPVGATDGQLLAAQAELADLRVGEVHVLVTGTFTSWRAHRWRNRSLASDTDRPESLPR